jgi:putative ABC transport system permease protein
MQQRPGRTILTLLSIVIGVAAVVSINIGTAATRTSYKQMFATVTGKATIEITAAGGVGFDEDVLNKVTTTDGVKAAAPLVEKPTTLSLGDRQIRIQIMGIDPARDGAVRDYEIVAGRQLQQGDEMLLDEEFARLLEMEVGDEVGLRTNRLRKPFEVVGVLRPRGGEVLRQAAMVFIPIDRAQYYFYPRGRTNLIDKIQVVTGDDDAEIERVRNAIVAHLPAEPKLDARRPVGNTMLMEHTLKSSEQGLKLTSLFSLLLASFIILNTFLMNVGERRRHLAIMRAIGATRRQITLSLLGESLLLGVLGTLLGMAAGVGAAWVVNQVLANALDVQLTPVLEALTLYPFLLGAAFGVGMAVVGALVPAVRAGEVSPLEGMSRVAPGDLRNWSLNFFLGSVALLVVGGGMIYGGIAGWLPIDVPMYGALVFLGGLVLLQTVLLRPLATFVSLLFRPFRPVEAGLALKQILRHNTRSSLTVGVLLVAGAAGVGMANSILDNVNDVHEWYATAIQGDYFVRALMPDMATGTAPDLPEGIREELENVPHKSIDGVVLLKTNVFRPVAGGELESFTAICVAREYVDAEPPAFDLIEGEIRHLRQQLFDGQVVVGSVLAQQLDVKPGDKLQVETVDGVQSLPIAAVTNEYMAGGMTLHMQRAWAVKRLGAQGYSGFVIRAPRETDVAAIKPQLEAICRKYEVLLHSYTDISRNINRIVGGIEWSLWVLVILGFVVAAFGVVNTLTMNVLEQTRELGLLRIVAMTKAQVRRTVVTQAMIIGGAGLPLGIAMGVVNAYVMNMAMMDALGHDIDFHFYPGLLAITLVGSVFIVLVAAIIPAYRAVQIDVVQALHYE